MSDCLIKGGTIIDGTGAEPVQDGTILISNGKIDYVGSKKKLEEGGQSADKIDASNLYVLPGFINSHDHLCHKKVARGLKELPTGVNFSQIKESLKAEPAPYLALLAARDALAQMVSRGVTTVRDCGSPYGVSYHLRRAFEEEVLPGPNLVISGQFLVMEGGHSATSSQKGLNSIANGIDGVRVAVREQLGRGADFIKIMASGSYVTEPERGTIDIPGFTVEEIEAAVQETHRADKPIGAHADGPSGIKNALEAGVDCIEHGLYLNEQSVEYMATHDISLVPTLSGRRRIIDYIKETGDPDFANEVMELEVQPNTESFKRAMRAGVRVGAGTDTQGEIIEELEIFVANGMDPLAAIKTATKNGAEICGLADQIGTLEEGKSADIVIVKDNPLEDISNLRKVRHVLKDGNKLNLEQDFHYSSHFRY